MKKKNGRIGQIEGRGKGKEDEREGWDEGGKGKKEDKSWKEGKGEKKR